MHLYISTIFRFHSYKGHYRVFSGLYFAFLLAQTVRNLPAMWDTWI